MKREPWQHEWGKGAPTLYGTVKHCTRRGCDWRMLSRKNRNRYRQGANGKWMHAPKDCEGKDGPVLEPHPAASIMEWPKKEKP